MNVDVLLECRKDLLERAERMLKAVEAIDEVGRTESPTWELRIAGENKNGAAAGTPAAVANADVVIAEGRLVKNRHGEADAPPSGVIPVRRSKRLDLAGGRRAGKTAAAEVGVAEELAKNPNAKVIQLPKRVSGPEAKGTGMSGFVATWCERNGVGSEVTTTMLRTVMKAEFPDKGWDQIRQGMSNGLFRGVKDGLLEKLGDGRYRVMGGKAKVKSKKEEIELPSEPAGMSEKERQWRELRAGMKAGPAASEE